MYFKGDSEGQADFSRRERQDHPTNALLAPPSNATPPEEGIPGTKAEQSESNERDSEQKSGIPPFLFATADELVGYCRTHNLTIAQVIWENEKAFRTDAEIRAGLHKCTSLSFQNRDSRLTRR